MSKTNGETKPPYVASPTRHSLYEAVAIQHRLTVPNETTTADIEGQEFLTALLDKVGFMDIAHIVTDDSRRYWQAIGVGRGGTRGSSFNGDARLRVTVGPIELPEVSAGRSMGLPEGYEIRFAQATRRFVPFWTDAPGGERALNKDGYTNEEAARKNILDHLKGRASLNAQRAQ